MEERLLDQKAVTQSTIYAEQKAAAIRSTSRAAKKYLKGSAKPPATRNTAKYMNMTQSYKNRLLFA